MFLDSYSRLVLCVPVPASVSLLAVPRGTSIEAPALDETMVKCEDCDRLFGESAIAKHSVRDCVACLFCGAAPC